MWYNLYVMEETLTAVNMRDLLQLNETSCGIEPTLGPSSIVQQKLLNTFSFF